MTRDKQADEDGEYESGLASLLEIYADLYPSIRERARVISTSTDPVVRSKLEVLDKMHRRRNDTRGSELMQRFDLTRSEARLASWLSDGGTITGYASIHGVSAGTVRTHLKAVFAKTGVHRQAQLASLVLTRRKRGSA